MRNFVFFRSWVVFLCLSCVVFAQPVVSFGAVSERHYSEVEVLLDEEFSLEMISSLARAPGSELEVLDGGKRVKAELESKLVDALIEAGAKVGVSGSFAIVKAERDEMAPPDNVVTGGSCTGITVSGVNYGNYDILDNTPFLSLTACSPITITGAPAGATVRCLDLRWEIYHMWPADVGAALLDYSGDVQYIAWFQESDAPGYFGESKDGLWDFVGEPVNQQWEFWAGDWANVGDTGFINEWEITLYYLDAGGYCGVTFTGICFEVIERVQVGDIDNYTGDFCGYYTDFTSQSTEMDVGVSYPITVNIDYADDGDRVGVWVDWNQDHDFGDADETISMTGSTSDGIYNGTITPPVGASEGPTRMRVRVQNDIGVGEEVPAEPCGTSEYGEVEDYTIVVIGEELPAGDMDGDGDVDIYDVDELCEMWLTDDVTCDIYPEGGDGLVDMQDFAVQAEDYGP